MAFRLLRRSSWSHCFLFLIISNLVTTMPVPPVKRSPEEIRTDGFSSNPKILEIQLPLKIASKEDIVAWAKYVMGLMASRINITLTTVKEPGQRNSEPSSRLESATSKSNKQHSSPNKPQNNRVSFNGRPAMNFGNTKQFAPIFEAPTAEIRYQEGFTGPARTSKEPPFLPPYPNLGTRPNFQVDDDFSRNSSVVVSPPSGMYLPLPARTSALFPNDQIPTRFFFDGPEKNFQNEFPSKTSAMSIFADRNRVSPARVNDLAQRNSSTGPKPILTVPFEAVITITRDEGDQQDKLDSESFVEPRLPAGREPPDEFPPYFDKNFTLTNESGQINVVLGDLDLDTTRKEVRANGSKDESKDSEKKGKSKKKSKKRQSAAVGELMKILNLLRRNSSQEVDEATLERFKAQKASLRKKEQNGRNETSQAQELDDDDDDDEEEGGGSIDGLLEILPLVAPILEDLSDPESETSLAEILEGALPIIRGLSEGDDGEAVDIAGLLVPVLLNSSGGKDGKGSDVSGILGPLIGLLAPFIGPVSGPLIGPLSQSSSNEPGQGGSSLADLIGAVAGPLSTPTGPGKMSPFSTLVAGVVASFSKDLVNGNSGIDIKNFVSAIVSGVFAGASAGLSNKGYRDSAVAPTSYGGYGPAQPASANPLLLIGSSIKDVISAGLKAASSLIAALTGIIGASSGGQPKPYGPPNYGPPTAYAPPANNAPQAYTQNKNRPSQSNRRPIRPR